MTMRVDLRSQAGLAALVARVRDGEDVVVEENGVPVARLVPLPDPTHAPRRPGSAIGKARLKDGWENDLPPELFEALKG